VTDLKKPVIITLIRQNDYYDWTIVLGPTGNAKDAAVLCKFANDHKIAGFLVKGIAQSMVSI